jgi:hypothetical protein
MADTDTVTAPLSTEQLATYRTHGYCVVPRMEDPGECRNAIADAALAPTVAALRALLQAWQVAHRDQSVAAAFTS